MILQCLLCLLVILIGLLSGGHRALGQMLLGSDKLSASTHTTQSCQLPTRRKEHHPSYFQAGISFHDGFVFTHSKTGSYFHYAAAFLSWNRLYIYAYEPALRRKCGYKGLLP